MSTDERICSIALTLIPGIGRTGAKRLTEAAGSAVDVFALRKELSQRISGVNATLLKALDAPEAFVRAERELEFAQNNHIEVLPFTDRRYPARLRDCVDAPVVLFFKGNTDLNRRRVISMVGTRKASEQGKQFCVDFLHDLQALLPDVLVVSGLAYGIDIYSHRAALTNRLSTVAVLAHGLDRIYPAVHRKYAVEMLAEGGLLTEYLTGTEPERYNFVGRNRIVAGMSDATIVIESAAKGGSLITADLANDYHRECFAVPGRPGDLYAQGCNNLIRTNRAVLLQSAEEFVACMGWGTAATHQPPVQQQLFPELPPEEEKIALLLREQGAMHIDVLAREADLPVYRISALLFELEMKGMVQTLPGGMYRSS
ncbi:MAG: DNA-processing protein DprA [Mediterranea sp.]|jgi:DNA processing protein|nr:DNA-processing protein DprA [Mediterranea sp.]